MNFHQLHKDLESLIDYKSSKYSSDTIKRLAYEKGYLVGLLLRLAQNDSYTNAVLHKILNSHNKDL